jgi:hypothetical protein
MRRSRLVGSLCALAVLATAVAAHAAPDGPVYDGVVGSYHDTKRGSEFYFDIPTHLATALTPGDVLEPDSFSQRVVYYGDSIGFCIDQGVPAGTAVTTYRFRGTRHERALAAARNAEELGEPRDEAIWAVRRAEDAELAP